MTSVVEQPAWRHAERPRRECRPVIHFVAQPASRRGGGDFAKDKELSKGSHGGTDDEEEQEPDPAKEALNETARQRALEKPSTKGQEIVGRRFRVGLQT